MVFFGDSLPEGWGMARNGSMFFPGKPYLNRDISRQTTLQMLGRFRQDVIDLHPAVLVLLAGTNDVAGNMGPMSLKQTTDNLQLMMELAKVYGFASRFVANCLRRHIAGDRTSNPRRS